MARPRQDQRKFAELYVRGPAYARGNWNICATGAGMKEAPPLDDVVIRNLIEKAGGTPPPLPDTNLAAAEAQANAEAEARQLDAALEVVAPPPPPLVELDVPAGDGTEELDPLAQLAAAADLGLPWAAMRDKLQDVILAIGSGAVRATAAQVAMVKYIVDQAKADASSAERVLGVVLLPVQGEGATLRLEPGMRQRSEERLRANAEAGLGAE